MRNTNNGHTIRYGQWTRNQTTVPLGVALEIKMELLFTLATLSAVLTVGEFVAVLREQYLQASFNIKDGTDPGEPLFLTPYIKKKDYQTGMCS